LIKLLDTSLIIRCTAREQDGGGRNVASEQSKILRNRSIIQSGVSQILIHSQQFNLMGNVEADVNAVTILFVCVIYGDCKHENKHSVSVNKRNFFTRGAAIAFSESNLLHAIR